MLEILHDYLSDTRDDDAPEPVELHLIYDQLPQHKLIRDFHNAQHYFKHGRPLHATHD